MATFVQVREVGPDTTTLTSGFVGPEWLEVAVELPEWPGAVIHARVALLAGSYRVMRLSIESWDVSDLTDVQPDEIRSTMLRDLPVQAVGREAARWAAHAGLLKASPGVMTLEGLVHGQASADLRYVASLYRLAVAVGDAPAVAVAEKLDVSRATAGRRIAEARRAGLLLGAPKHPGGAKSRLGGGK